jgi:hypothetical protein
MTDDYHDDCHCTECATVRSLGFIGEQLERIANILNNYAMKGKI